VRHRSQGSPSTPGSVLITVTVNGKRQTYAPSYWGAVLVPAVAPYTMVVEVDADGGLPMTSNEPGVQVNVECLHAPTFGSPLSPTDDPVLNQVVDAVVLVPIGGQPGHELLSFFVSSASK